MIDQESDDQMSSKDKKTKWKTISDGEVKPNSYEISNTGLVRSKKTGKKLAQNISNSGYKRVMLDSVFINKKTQNAKRIQRTVHQLVFVYFGSPSDVEKYLYERKENGYRYVINHKDGDKTNNNIRNLELATNRENHIHAINMGLIKVGEESIHTTKGRTNELVNKICQLIDDGMTPRDIREYLHLPDTKSNRQFIIDIRRKKSWTSISKNYKFYNYNENKNFKIYNVKFIKGICKLLDENKTHKEITDILMRENDYPKSYRAKIRSLVWFIHKRQRYCDISEDYNFWK